MFISRLFQGDATGGVSCFVEGARAHSALSGVHLSVAWMVYQVERNFYVDF